MKLWLVQDESNKTDYYYQGPDLLAVCTSAEKARELQIKAFGNSGTIPYSGIIIEEIESDEL